MVTMSVVNSQLKKAGCPIRLWGRAEVKELCEILLPGENIAQAVNGQYEGGFALLVATDFRVLLIDKKPKYLTLKDVRYDMITELDFANRLLDSTIRIYTPNRELHFTALNGAKLRTLFTHTQHKVMEIRSRYMMHQFQQQLQSDMPPGLAMATQISSMQDFRPQEAKPSETKPQEADHFYRAVSEPVQEHSGRQHNQHSQSPDDESNEDQKRLALAMGAAGLRSIIHNGQIVKDYVTVPFVRRWHKRPYGVTKSPTVARQIMPSA